MFNETFNNIGQVGLELKYNNSVKRQAAKLSKNELNSKSYTSLYSILQPNL